MNISEEYDMPGPEISNEERLLQFYITYDAAKMDISDLRDVFDTFIDEQDNIKKNKEDISSGNDLNIVNLTQNIGKKNYFYTMMCSRFELKEGGIDKEQIETIYNEYIQSMSDEIKKSIDEYKPSNKMDYSSTIQKVNTIAASKDKGIAIRELALLQNKFTAQSDPNIEIMTLEEELGHLVQLNSLSTPEDQKDYVMKNIPNIDNILSTSISDIAKEIKKEGYLTNKDKQGDVTKKIKLAIRDVLIQQSHTNAYRGYGKATEKEDLKKLIRDAKLDLEDEYSSDPKFISDLLNLYTKLNVKLSKGDAISINEATIIWLNYVQDKLHLNDPEIPQATKDAIYNQDLSTEEQQEKKIDNLIEGISEKINIEKGKLKSNLEPRIKNLETKLKFTVGAIALGALIVALSFAPPIAIGLGLGGAFTLQILGATLAGFGLYSTSRIAPKYYDLSTQLSNLHTKDNLDQSIGNASMPVRAASISAVSQNDKSITNISSKVDTTTYNPIGSNDDKKTPGAR
jgi:hypothetical protein